MVRYLITFICLALNGAVQAQNPSQHGIELDALPWLSGGYYISGWYGEAHVKYRALAAKLNVPGQLLADGFKDKQIAAYALIVDYFPNVNFTGAWYGAGFEYWRSKISNTSDNTQADYDNTVFTVGLGYVWRISDSLYLNPWAALHMVVSGDEDITVGNNTYHQDTVTPSGSIKLGWEF